MLLRTTGILFLIVLNFCAQAQLTQKAYDSVRKILPFPQANKLDRQQSNSNFTKYTLQYSDMSWVSGPHSDLGNPVKHWYVLSADILPEFIVGGPWMKYPIHLTPRFKVRIFHNNEMLGDSSFPIRTPSFMPGATIHIPFHTLKDDPLFIQYASLAFFHHSNGQDGKELDSSGHFNKYNGNFSTNFIEVNYNLRWRKIFPANPVTQVCENAGYRDWFAKIGFEIHVGTEATLKERYGLYRLNMKGESIMVRNKYIFVKDRTTKKKIPVSECYATEKERIIFNATLIGGARTRELNTLRRRINLDIGYFLRIPHSPNASFFAMGGYYGSDPYNVYFDGPHYFFIRFGIALGFHIAPASLQPRKRTIDPFLN